MSVDFTRIIPTDPWWVPTAAQADAAVAVVDHIMNERRGELEIKAPGRVEFVDAGANWETAYCPSCRYELGTRWTVDQISAAYDAEKGYGSLTITTPCCASEISLNDVDYRWQQGFASWWISVRDANRGTALSDNELEHIEVALGHRVREINSHL